MDTAKDVQDSLKTHLREHSGLEQHRTYLGMSAIADCPLELYRRFVAGRELNDRMHAMCYLGYLFEGDLKARLGAIGYYRPGSERELVAAFDSRYRGHTDGETTEGELLEIKSVHRDKFERIRDSGRLTTENYQQVQTYMRHGGYERAAVIYVCRDDLSHLVRFVRFSPRVAQDLDDKARLVLAAADASQSPSCTCGRCRS